MKDRWKNRRRMAWSALIAGLLFPLLLLASASEQLGTVAGAFYVFVGAVVGSYIGFATFDDRWSGYNDGADLEKGGDATGRPSRGGVGWAPLREKVPDGRNRKGQERIGEFELGVRE